MYFQKSLILIVLALCVAASVSPIVIHGNKFFNSSDGNQFFIKGIAYQRNIKQGIVYDSFTDSMYIDSLAEPALCLNDLEYLKQLGVNTVRVFQIDPTRNHDVCMNAFANCGIYVLADLADPEHSINREDPHWDLDLYKRFTSVVDAMNSYVNVLGFYVGNEIVISTLNSHSAPFAKAAVRDIKRYIRDRGYRQIPIGYSSNDDAATRVDAANYFVCDDYNGTDSAVDFYSINMYEWCGYSSFETSGYKERTIEFSQLPVPVFLSEFGCNTASSRPFTEMEALYGPAMLKVWSGGIVYEFFQNENRYGLVEETSPGTLHKLDDYSIVQRQFMESKPLGIHRSSNANPGRGNVNCPQVLSKWNALSVLPKSPLRETCECLNASLSCVLTPYVKVHETNLLNEVCLLTDCLAINGDGTKGEYGMFSGCGIKQRISYALNKHWVQNDRNAAACSFESRAVLIPNKNGTSVDSTFTSDGRICREAIGKYLVPVNVSREATALVDDKASVLGKENTFVQSTRNNTFVQYTKKSGAVQVTHWGVAVITKLVLSSIYWAT